MAVTSTARTVASAQSLAIGQLGSDVFTDTTARTGRWSIITALSDTVFTTLTAVNSYLNGATTGGLDTLTLPKGMTLYGQFSAITLASGSVVAYRADWLS